MDSQININNGKELMAWDPAEKDLCRSKSYWLEIAMEDYIPSPPLEGDKKYDFLIIGGGFTGLSTAYFIKEKRPDLKIAILESMVVGFGASGRNDGFNMTLLGENIIQLTHSFGKEKARAAHRWAIEAVNTVKDLVELHKIDCDYEHTGFLQIGVSKPHIKKIKKEVELHREFGTDATYLTKEETLKLLPSTPANCGMIDPHCGIMNPAKYCKGMKNVLLKMEVDFFENSPVRKIHEGKTIKAETPSGSVSAPYLMIATDAYSNKIGYLRNKVLPIFTYIVMTEPLSANQMNAIGWKGRWGVETTRRFVHYFRLTGDNRITIGGGDAFYYYNRATDRDQRPSAFKRLEEDLIWLFPPLKGIKFTHRWGGPIAATFDFFPVAGVCGKNRNVYYSSGYTGHGVSLANASGKIIRDLYLGEETHRTRLFFINRSTVPVPPEPLLYPSAAIYMEIMKIRDHIDNLR